jgi:hypothetical protein
MTRIQRLESLEAAYQRRHWARYCPKGWTLDAFLDAAIAWLEMPIDELHARMPMFTEAELLEMQSRLPAYRRARMAGR